MEQKFNDATRRQSPTISESNFEPVVDAEYSRRGIELMTRHSIYSIASMGTEHSEDRPQLRKWNLKVLRVREYET